MNFQVGNLIIYYFFEFYSNKKNIKILMYSLNIYAQIKGRQKIRKQIVLNSQGRHIYK